MLRRPVSVGQSETNQAETDGLHMLNVTTQAIWARLVGLGLVSYLDA